MAKKIEDVVIPERRKSIRDIPIPENRRRAERKPVISEDATPPAAPRTPIKRHRRGRGKRILLSLALGILIVGFGILSLMKGATLSYTPKSSALTFNNEAFTAYKAGNAGLFYSVVKLSREKGREVPAGSEQEVSRKASGVIIVYNDSAQPQPLVVNTRFESAAGKIYRTQQSITVPARKSVNGSTQPGTVEVTVYADQPGESYNSAPSDFTVPGLKGTSKFESVYARSKTPLAGGFVGKEKVVKPEDLTKAKSELEAALKEELWTEAEAEVPVEFILFRNLSTFSFEDMPQTAGDGGNVVINRRGHIYGIMFKRSDLANYLGQKKISLPASDVVEIPDFSSLNLSFASNPPADLLSLNDVSFKITGDAKLVWVTDEVALKADLAGKHKRDIPGILNNYPTIASASVTVRPFWKSSLPDDVEKIKVVKKDDE